MKNNETPTKNIVHAQLVVNMEVNSQNKHCRKLKNNRFKLRHAPYSNRCSAFSEAPELKHNCE